MQKKGVRSMEKQTLYSIGKVSKICDVSSRTLRYYEEIGLLRPDSINEHNGYRYYSAESMYRVQMIRYLGDEGFTLEEIGEILREEDMMRLREILQRVRLVSTDKKSYLWQQAAVSFR